jgi:hypothetical protein
LQADKGRQQHQQQWQPRSKGLPQRQQPRSKTIQCWVKRSGTCWWWSSGLGRPSLCLLAGSTQVGGGLPAPLDAPLAAWPALIQRKMNAQRIQIAATSHQPASCAAFPLPRCSRCSLLPPGAVENLEDCASINHNWINGHSVHWTWALLQQERRQAEAAIEDCRPLCG